MKGLYIPTLRFLIGTFKFTYDGQRVGKDDTPASVSHFSFSTCWIYLTRTLPKKLGMEDGEQIDAFLEQVS